MNVCNTLFYRRYDVVSSAYIIYPGNELHQEGADKNIGALPLVPGMSTSCMDEVREILKALLHKAHLV